MSEKNWTDFDIRSLFDEPIRAVILGATGSGKTRFARLLINAACAHKQKVFVIDPKNEFSDLHALRKSDFYEYQSFIRKIVVIKSINPPFESEEVETLSELAACLTWEFAPALVYIEETPEIVGKHDVMSINHKYLRKVLTEGRSQRAGIIVVSQMLSELHLSFIRQSTDIFVFAMLPSELATVEKQLGLPANTLKFDLPTREQRNAGDLKDLYRFYHIQGIYVSKHERLKVRGKRNESEKPAPEIGSEEEENEPTLKAAPITEVNPVELEKGIKVEMEHTTDPKTAETIARQHLAESPDYYKALGKMERKLKKGK